MAKPNSPANEVYQVGGGELQELIDELAAA